MQQNNGLDKNQIISFVLFSLILFGFMFYFQGKQAKGEAAKPKQPVKTEQAAAKPAEVQNLNPQINQDSIKTVSLKNDLLDVQFSSLGGQISSVELLKFKAYNQKTDKDTDPLYLFNKNNASYGFQFKDKTGKVFNTKDLVFSPTVNGNTVTMQSNVDGAIIQFLYTLNEKYEVGFKVKTQGLTQLVNDGKANFTWNYDVRGKEKGRSQEAQHTEFSYGFNNYKSSDYDGRTTMEEPKETLNWIGIKQQFFGAVIEAKSGFTNSKGNQDQPKDEKGEFLKTFTFDGQVQLAGNELNQDFTWYFMPLDLKLLKSYDKNFDEILPLGWSFIGTLNRHFFIPIYNLLTSWGIAAGWVIFLMTIITKIILSPVMFKQHKLSAMMRVIRPEIDEVNAKFKDADAMKKQQATMAVYKKAGVNQMA
ncbi:MAG: membrane protein insertase YidC, partial [Chryseobacterium sp.]|nr:membrane protein insertase YidC [Chryseobacterium sp.]